MNLIRYERRTPAMAPFGLVRHMLRWHPFRGIEFPEFQSAYKSNRSHVVL